MKVHFSHGKLARVLVPHRHGTGLHGRVVVHPRLHGNVGIVKQRVEAVVHRRFGHLGEIQPLDAGIQRSLHHIVPAAILGKVAHAQRISHLFAQILERIVALNGGLAQLVNQFLHIGVIVVCRQQAAEPILVVQVIARKHRLGQRTLPFPGQKAATIRISNQLVAILRKIGVGVAYVADHLLVFACSLLLSLRFLVLHLHQHGVESVLLLLVLLLLVFQHHVRVHRGQARQQRIAHAVFLGKE